MRNISLTLVMCLFLPRVGFGQYASPPPQYPTTCPPPSSPWGGYVVPEQVPYQPTLPGGTPSYETANDGFATGEPTSPVMTPYVPYPTTESAACAAPVSGLPRPGTLPAEMGDGSGEKSLLPPGTRNGVFQKIKFTGAYLPRLESDSLGTSDLQLEVVFGLPLITRETPLVITPTYAVHFFDGPNVPDVPSRVHDAAVAFQHFRRFGDSWILLLDLTVGEFADDVSFDASDAFRVTGGGAVVYEVSPTWKWVMGATYVDRANTDVLPIAGFVYEPNDDVEYKLVFPVPKVSWRLPWTNVPDRDERWFYVGGEFGGGVWAVQRTSGATDELDITDWRVFMGLERKIVGGLSRHVEIGYVFGRELQYASAPGHVSLDDTLMLRAGMTY